MMLDRIISVSNRTTVFRDGGNAVKVYRASYPKSSILNEGMNLTLAEELGLPVPQFRQITTVENRWAMIMDYIAGKTFLRMLTESPLKTDALLSRWTALQRTIHEKRCAALPQVNDLAAQRIEASGLPSDLIRRLSARLQTLPRGHEVCHGEFALSNAMESAGGKAFALDWKHAMQGSGEADGAWTYLLMQLDGFDKEAELYRERFVSLKGVDAALFEQWIPLGAAAHYRESNERKRALLLSYIETADRREREK